MFQQPVIIHDKIHFALIILRIFITSHIHMIHTIEVQVHQDNLIPPAK
jgi:hypothetical protein